MNDTRMSRSEIKTAIKVSVIIPVYKTEKYLSKCLESILASTMQEMEVICVNDGSPDNCGHILESFSKKDGRIVIVNQENSGQGAARNQGLLRARGETIHFCDSDDYIHPTMYTRLYNHLVQSEADVVCSGTNLEYDVHANQKCCDDIYFKVNFVGCMKSKPEMITTVDAAIWNKLFRRDFLLNNKICFPNAQFVEDIAFIWQWMTHDPKLFFTKEKLYTYVRREASAMSSVLAGDFNLRQNDFFNVMDSVHADLQKRHIFNDYRVIYWESFLGLIYFILTSVSGDCQKSFICKLAAHLPNKDFDYLNATSTKSLYNDLVLLKDGKNPILKHPKSPWIGQKMAVYVAGIRVAKARKFGSTNCLRILGLITVKTKYHEG